MSIDFTPPDIETLSKKYMLVDMHMHTRFSHDCGTPLPALADKARSLGVHVAITDHNTIRGAMHAHDIAHDVLHPGVEITTYEGKDILLYFYSARELEAFFMTIVQPHIRDRNSLRSGRTGIRAAELLEQASSRNCVIAIPHPFAVGPRRSYTFFRRNGRAELLDHVHAIEVMNQAVPHRRNLAAIGWAAQCRKTAIGGSDGHILGMLGTAFTYSEASSWKEFLDNIKSGEVHVVGEERKMHHHMLNMGRILTEKARLLENRRIRKE